MGFSSWQAYIRIKSKTTWILPLRNKDSQTVGPLSLKACKLLQKYAQKMHSSPEQMSRASTAAYL